MKAAELNGSRIDRMVLVDVAGRVDRGFGTLVGSLIADARSPYRSPEEYVETIRASGLISPWNEYWERCYRYGLVSSNQRLYVRTDPKAVEEDRAYGRAQDPYERWTFLTMPVLLLRAVEELHPGTGFAVPRDDVDLFLQRVPLAQLSEIDANHLTINTHPDTVKEVVGFLAI